VFTKALLKGVSPHKMPGLVLYSYIVAAASVFRMIMLQVRIWGAHQWHEIHARSLPKWKQ